MPALEFLVGLHMPTKNDLTIGDSLSYDETTFDTRYPADVTWRFKTYSGFSNEIPDSDVLFNSHPSIPGNHDEQVHHLYSCLVGIAQPLALPSLLFPPLEGLISIVVQL